MALDLEGADLLADALINAPASVIDAAWDAGEASARVLRRSIARFTNVDTGYLVSNGEVVVMDAFTIQYENLTPYAVYVNAEYQFVEQGTDAARSEVDTIYEAAYDAVASTFGSGR